jgi:hypothetical protein
MSVLDDFARMRLYRTRASEFEVLADDAEVSPEAQRRYRIVAAIIGSWRTARSKQIKFGLLSTLNC